MRENGPLEWEALASKLNDFFFVGLKVGRAFYWMIKSGKGIPDALAGSAIAQSLSPNEEAHLTLFDEKGNATMEAFL